MYLLGALFAFPMPAHFIRAPLHALTTLGPLAIQSDMYPVVFDACAVCPHPDIITSRSVKVHFVMHNSQFPWLVTEILTSDQFVRMGGPGVGQDLDVGIIAGTHAMGIVVIATRLWPNIFAVYVPLPDLRKALLVEKFGFNSRQAICFFKDKILIYNGIGLCI
jgi:hypothetical protein